MSSQQPPTPTNCDTCGQQFSNIEELHKHKTEAHQGENNRKQTQ